ncbi:hypothetical protein RDI58_013284 [Solanum bulbocastanum]|uniref:Uncharacterized protein n=1 Tax=Solanum bulbocastanum TaxID=147425 RepID=A0AAN8TMJ3_SOLBU
MEKGFFKVFIPEISTKRLYIWTNVVKDYQLKLPSSMTIRDSAGREFEANFKIW